jgi:hypothetical protein
VIGVRRIKISRAAAVVVVCAALSLGIVVPVWATSNVALSPYAPFPQAALTTIGASFARPSHAQVASARVSVAQAYAIAHNQTGNLPKGVKITMRLGLFSDAIQGKTATLTYAVTFDGVVVPSYGPTGGPAGRELIVIVNAKTERVIEAFSYR